ncbi:MAG: WG repeat-containing protein [Oscillospiraceae bacterium]|nr:WG repeat-containing protein [Oscillospiraceae bacterium]
MKNKFLALVLILSLVLSFTACGSEPEAEEVFDPRPTADDFQVVEIEQPDVGDAVLSVPSDEHSFTWLVEPALEYDWLYYCGGHDVFNTGDGKGVDEKTGLPTAEYCGTHSGGRLKWLYDEKLDIITKFFDLGGSEGWLPMNEFEVHFPDEADTIKVIIRVDSTKLPDSAGNIYRHEGAFHGVAAAVGNNFVTDFIYTDGGWGRAVYGAVALVDSENMHGIINKSGDIIVPFEFEELLLISKNTAFARVGDYWGIIGFGETETAKPYINTALFDELFPFTENTYGYMQVPADEIFVGIELPATVADIVKNYQLVDTSTQWWDSTGTFISTFACHDGFGVFDDYDRRISIYTLNTSVEIDVNNCFLTYMGCRDEITESPQADDPGCDCEWIDLAPLMIFDEDSTVSITAYEKQFVNKLMSAADRAETVEELIESIMGYENVDSIRVFRTADDLNRGGAAIFEGAWQKGMCYEIVYDDGESWLQSMWRF